MDDEIALLLQVDEEADVGMQVLGALLAVVVQVARAVAGAHVVRVGDEACTMRIVSRHEIVFVISEKSKS